MQRVGAIIGDEMVGLTTQCELRPADTVGVAAGDRAEMTGECLVVPQGSEAERDVFGPAGTVGRVDLGDDAAVAQEAHAQAVVVSHRKDVDGLPALRRAVRRVIERGGGVGRSARDRGCQRRHDRKGTRELCAAARAEVPREVCHDIPFPSCLSAEELLPPRNWLRSPVSEIYDGKARTGHPGRGQRHGKCLSSGSPDRLRHLRPPPVRITASASSRWRY